MERLAHRINKAVAEGFWKPIKLSKDGPSLSHLFFTDDLVLFSEADSSQASSIMAILDQFAYFSPLFFASYEYFQSELHWAIFRSAAFSQTDNYKYLQFLG